MELLSSTNAKGRIAVIDDDAVFVDLMRDLLAVGEGYEVVCAPHWLQSIEFVRDAQPDLIILDLMLGRELSGWGVLELLRETRARRRFPSSCARRPRPLCVTVVSRRADAGRLRRWPSRSTWMT